MTAANPARPLLAGRGLITRQQLLGLFYLALAALVAAVFGGGVPGSSSTTFELNLLGSSAIQVSPLVLPSAATAYMVAAICAFAGITQLVRGFGTRRAIVLGVVLVLFIFSFLTWAAAGRSMSLVGVLQSTLLRSVPITFGAISGLLCERSGVVNIAIEGMLLTAAFVAAVVASATANLWIGLIAAVITGGLLAWVLAVLAIRYRVDQIIAGTVINIGASGITAFISARVLQTTPELNNPGRFGNVDIPVLAQIPVIGPVFFSNNIFVYVMFLLIVVVHLGLFYTRWGLRVRAVGEHPRAADTVGIDVLRVRYIQVILGGMVAGFGGAYFTLGSTGSFDRDMTAGRGFIGLAAMIFGRWTPIGGFLAGLVFGFADSLQNRLSILNVPIPSDILLMLPYLVTILAVAGLVGRARAPAADGTPYKKD